MKKPRSETSKKTDAKLTAVSTKIRNLYDSVLKENVPQTLRQSSQFNTARGAEKASTESESPPGDTAGNPSAVTQTGASDGMNTAANIGQGETNPPLPDQNGSKIDTTEN